MDFKIFHSKSILALLLLAILFLIGLLFYYQRAMHSRVDRIPKEVIADSSNQKEKCPANLHAQKMRISREFLLNRDYGRAFDILYELVTENSLTAEEYPFQERRI